MFIASKGLNKTRKFIWPLVHRFLSTISDAYAVSQTTEEEYAATVLEGQPDLEAKLPELRFQRTPISALKIRLDGNISDGSWVRRESLLADTQLHVVLHQLDDRPAVDVYAHTEDNWIRHPLLHLRKKNYSAKKGVSLVRELFEAEASNRGRIVYTVKPRYRRNGQWILYAIHLISKQIARKLHEQFSEPTVFGTSPDR